MKRLLAAGVWLAAILCAVPALATPPAPVTVADLATLHATPGSAGQVALVESYSATAPIVPAPEVQYTYSAGPCPIQPLDPDASVLITGGGGAYWCLSAGVGGVDIRNFGARLDFTPITVAQSLPLSAFSASGGDTIAHLQPLSFSVTGGSYNNATGATSLTTSAAHGIPVGGTIGFATLTGTGGVSSILAGGPYVALQGTNGSTLVFTAAAGLGATTFTGGTPAAPYYPSFPYTASTPRQIAVTIAGLQQNTSGACPAPNGIYPATWQVNNGLGVVGILIKGVSYCSGWALQPNLVSASISYVTGTDNGPASAGAAYPAVNDPIDRAIKYAGAASANGKVYVSDGPGGEGIGAPLDVGQVNGTPAGTYLAGVDLRLTGIHALAPPAAALIGWDEGYPTLRTVTYHTPNSWNGPTYTTPTDSAGNGTVWSPPPNWPQFSLTKVFAQSGLVGIELSAPMIMAKGQQIYVHNSDVGGADASYLEGLWTISDVAAGYECSVAPCPSSGYLLANSNPASIATTPQFQFASMKFNGGSIELDLTYPRYQAFSGSITISRSDYPAVLSNGGAGCTFSYSTIGSPAVTGILLTGTSSGSPCSASFPAGYDPAGTQLSNAIIYAAVPHGMFNIGLGVADAAIENSKIYCENQIGCVPITNYSNQEGFPYLELRTDIVERWNHIAEFSLGANSHVDINGGVYAMVGGHPSPDGKIASTIGTLGVRSGIALAFEGRQGDDVVGGGVLLPYSWKAWHTGANTVDVAFLNVHAYNGIGTPTGSMAANQSEALDGPYYPDIEGEFDGTGAFDFSEFDGGEVLIRTSKSTPGTCATISCTPYVQVSANWNYRGYAAFADAPLEIENDCLTYGCASLPNADGSSQGLDPNQFAAPAPAGGTAGGYLSSSRFALADYLGNIGGARTWSPNTLASNGFYNGNGAVSFDAPASNSLFLSFYSFTGNIKPGAMTVVSTGAVVGGVTVPATGTTTGFQKGMAIYGPGVPPGETIASATPGASFTLALKLVGLVPTGSVFSLPYSDVTASGATALGNVVHVSSVTGVYPGEGVQSSNSQGLASIQPGTTVTAVDPVGVNVTLSLPITQAQIASGQDLLFSGADYNNPANTPETGYRISAASIFPQPGTTISNPGLLPVATGYVISGIQPATNQITIQPNLNSSPPPPSNSGLGANLTVGGVTGWNGDIHAGSWIVQNVTYDGVPLSQLVRPGMMINDSGGGNCLPANSWIDSYNPISSVLTVQNASDAPVSSACVGDTFSVTPNNYVFQPEDSGSQLLLLGHAGGGAGSYSLYLPPYMPAGWSVKLVAATQRPPITVSELDGQATNQPTINGANGAPVSLASIDPTQAMSINAVSSGTFSGGAGGTIAYTNYTIPSRVAAPLNEANKVTFSGTLASTINLSQGVGTVIIEGPGGTVSALTLQLPFSPWDGEKVYFQTTRAITSLTVQDNGGGATTVAMPASLAVGGGFIATFDAGAGKWYGMQ